MIWLDFPFREEPLRYDGSETPAPPDVRTYRWQPGERVELAFEVLDHDDHARVLRELCVDSTQAAGQSAAWVSVERAAELAAWGLWRWHYRPDPPRLIETAAFDRDGIGETGDRDAMHVCLGERRAVRVRAPAAWQAGRQRRVRRSGRRPFSTTSPAT